MIWRFIAVVGICFTFWMGAVYPQSNIIGSGVRGDAKVGSASPYLLGNLSTAPAIAYSFRQISSTATKAIRVQRTSDNAQSDIGFSSGNLDTTTLGTFCAATTCNMTTWYDQSGNARDAPCVAVCSVVVNAGTNNTLNGHVCQLYTGNQNTDISFTFTLSQPTSYAILFHLTSVIANNHLTDGRGTGRQLIGFNSTQYQIYAGSSALTGGTSDATTTHTAVGIFNGASSSLLIDGVSTASGDPGSNGTTQQSIGAGNGAGTSISGYICEYIVDASTMSGGDQSTIHTSWTTYWGSN